MHLIQFGATIPSKTNQSSDSQPLSEHLGVESHTPDSRAGTLA